MYYSNGNYEAFARPRRPEGVEDKSAWIVGAGLAGLSAAVFLLRDGGMKGDHVHIFEELALPGGSLDGIFNKDRGFIIRGGREMENHFECLWDMFRSIPSLEVENASVLDEFYWLNKDDPNYSKMRATEKCGQDAHTDKKFGLSDAALKEIVDLFMATEESLEDKTIEDMFSEDFFESNFWLYWCTMFAFEPWHSAVEMRRYIQRFIHHVGGLPDLSALKFTKYNQYESLVQPLVQYLKKAGVQFHYATQVQDIELDITRGKKTATSLVYTEGGEPQIVKLTESDLVFVTNGSITESSTYGTHKTAPTLNASLGGSWQLWKNLASKDPAFGRPEKFCGNIDKTKFVSATLTTLDGKVPPYIEKICQRDPFSGGVVTGGIVSAKDSGWLMSWTLNRQPHFKAQPKDQLVVWIYGLYGEHPGDYVQKPMFDCTGEELAQEWLYHIGVPEEEIQALAANSTNCVPCMLPYVMSYFMPRAHGDRPDTVPEGSVNLAFIGNFAETPRDTVFTTEYSVRTAMEAVYRLLEIDRGVPEVFASCFDIRVLLDSAHKLMDGKKITEMKLPFLLHWLERKGLDRAKGTLAYEMLEKYGLV